MPATILRPASIRLLLAVTLVVSGLASTRSADPPAAGRTTPRTGTTTPFGSGSLTTERSRDGHTVTGQTQKFGSGAITRRSDGSSSETSRFGSGTIQRDTPARK